MKTLLLTAAAAAAFLATGLCAQDVVRLTTGDVMKGRVVEESPDSIVLEFDGGSMELMRSMIAEIVRGPQRPEKTAEQKALLTLSRFTDYETHHFLYRKGRRVGYRVISVARHQEEGVPGYRLRDRLVFLPGPGVAAEAEMLREEFVDAELQAWSFRYHESSGTSVYELRGRREDGRLVIEEHAGGQTSRRTAALPGRLDLPGMLLRRLAKDRVPLGGYRPFTVFDPRKGTFIRTTVERFTEQTSAEGQRNKLLVLRRRKGERVLDTWLDMAGKVVRQQIGSPYLVSERTGAARVQAWIRGESASGGDDQDLEFVAESLGIRLLRPDPTWELERPREPARRVVSLLKPAHKATVDVFHIDDLPPGATVEGLTLELFGRMQAGCEAFEADGPVPGKIGDRNGLRFRVRCRRRDRDISTLGGACLQGDRAVIVLCAAPETSFGEALPAFRTVMESLRLIGPGPGKVGSTEAADPFGEERDEGHPVEEGSG